MFPKPTKQRFPLLLADYNSFFFLFCLFSRFAWQVTGNVQFFPFSIYLSDNFLAILNKMDGGILLELLA